MSGSEADNPRTEPDTAPRAGVTPPPAARGSRRATTQVVPPSSTDAFATPSDPVKSDEPQVFLGSEPAIFGGVNPIGGAGAMAQPGLPPEPTAAPMPESVPDDDELPPRGLISGSVKSLIRSVQRSTALLILTFLVVGILGTGIVTKAVPQEVYVSTTVRLTEHPALTPEEARAFREDVIGVLPRVPDVARTLLRQRQPTWAAGFLNIPTLFQDSGATKWLDDQSLQLRVESDDPDRDQDRLRVAAASFIQVLQSREQLLTDKKQKLANLEVHLQSLEKQQEEAASDAQRQGPATGADAERQKKLERSIETAKAEVARATRAIEIWPHAEASQTIKVDVSDNRQLRARLISGVWALCVALFGGAIASNERRKQREARERRIKRVARPQAKG